MPNKRTQRKTTSTARRRTKKARRTSLLNAAAAVLAKAQEPMTCPEMVEAVLKAGTWKTRGKTPAATLSAAIYREIQVRGKEARFAKAERGRFRLRAARRSSGRKEAGLRATAGRVPPVWHQTAKRRAGLAAKANATARRGVATIGAG